MKPNPVLNLSGVAAAMTLALLAAVASAQYPSRPIRLLVPNPPGGATDTIARVVSPRLGEALGQRYVEQTFGAEGIAQIELT